MKKILCFFLVLTLLLSRDQSRGTDAILERLRADIANKQENRILLVPELISHDMERRLCQAAGDTVVELKYESHQIISGKPALTGLPEVKN